MYGYASRMYWVLAAVFLLVMLAVPRLRPVALVGCVILGGMLAWGMVQRLRGTDPADLPERGRPTSPAAMVQAVPIGVIELEDLQLTGGGAPFRLTGHIINDSKTQRVKSVMLEISRRDCYTGALDPSGCVVIWRDRRRIEVSVPPQEERDFAISIWARGEAPRVVGAVRDEFTLVAASGEPVRSE
jgi:hypothetical protein